MATVTKVTNEKKRILKRRLPSEISVQVVFLKAHQTIYGISNQTLANRAGLSVGHIKNQISKNFPSRFARLKVEAALGIRIWSSESDFHARQAELKSKVPSI